MNLLLEIIKVAYVNKILINNNQDFIYSIEDLIIPIPKETTNSKWETKDGKKLYDSKELAGVAGLFRELKKDPKLRIIYSNDLGSSITGIDCIAFKNGNYIVCEAKGTTSKKTYVSKFLRKTKTKGRQMSWDWIWRSLVEFAEDSRNAIVFLEIYENVIKQENITRLISISTLEKINQKFSILETRFYNDFQIKHLKGMQDYSNQKTLIKWLLEIKKENLFEKASDLILGKIKKFNLNQ
ncbi:hypothetical protein SAMN05444411_102231 [Lutibacter oricola]|uniref:Uncharacterized protein n=1 Tax=Lutibacter oricola TaxID=762486 RepID=A0A1H2WMH2_9FLAO|nr:hypothetical protein [Lutibacter oricola]SDW81454.1 hypothetical protein SAMN05444411_102231 [Lutibacter oricola]